MFAMENALSHDAPPPMTSLKQGFHLFTGRTLRQLGANDVQLQEAVDIMGKRSARAQGLKKAITSYVQMTTSDHRLFLLVARGGALKGMMRVGQRQLFVRRSGDDPYCQINPTCVLDFYVHESCQRRGEGRQIYDQMIAHEGKQPHELGYDRPSAKFLGFLAKHFGLKGYVPQANNFVVYDQYWSRGGGGGERGRGGARNNGAARSAATLGGASGAAAASRSGARSSVCSRSRRRRAAGGRRLPGRRRRGRSRPPPSSTTPAPAAPCGGGQRLGATAAPQRRAPDGRSPRRGAAAQRPPAVRPLPGPLPPTARAAAHARRPPRRGGGVRRSAAARGVARLRAADLGVQPAAAAPPPRLRRPAPRRRRPRRRRDRRPSRRWPLPPGSAPAGCRLRRCVSR